MLPRELGCGSGVTCWRRLRDWQTDGVWDRIHRALLDRLGEADMIDWSRDARRVERPGKKGGVAVGPTPPDRGKGGTKRHIVTDRPGIPLAVRLTGANRHESTVFRRAARRHPADQAPLRAAVPAPGQAPRRQGVRCPPLPPGALPPRDQGPDRPQGDRPQGAVGPPPLGGRAHAGVAQPRPPFNDPLRTRRLDSPGVPHPRLRADLLQPPASCGWGMKGTLRWHPWLRST